MRTLKKPYILSIILVFFFSGIREASAQFYTTGGDPASAKWYSITIPSYKIIYPEGLDSLAGVYGRQLELYRRPVSRSIGLLPGLAFKKPTPVILHAFHSVSNGSVAWAPHRMDLYTIQDPYMPEPMPWIQSLAVHESRHVGQMQFGHNHVFKPLYWLTGELAASGLSAVYPSTHLLEGDAVVAETGLTDMGRGRNADFLSYYMAAFDSGDWRNWHKWRWGSYRRYAPDHYALGYLTIAGTRYLYDDPLFMERYFDQVSRKPWRLFNLQRQMKAASGKKFSATFSDIMHEFDRIWKEEASLRAPFTAVEPLMPIPSWYTEYGRVSKGGDDLYAVKSSLRESSYLVKVSPSGEEQKIRPFTSSSSAIVQSGGKLFWSESVPDPRWGLKRSSRIRYVSEGEKHPKIHDLTKDGRLFNPAASTDGKHIAVVDYPLDGRTWVDILDADTGETVRKAAVPDTLQAVEPAWIGDDIYFSGISPKGFGIYRLGSSGVIEKILSPSPVTIHAMSSDSGKLVFSSDRTGVDEIYTLDPSSGKVMQLTSSKYGVDLPHLSGEDLYVSQVTAAGHLLSKAEMAPKEVDFSERHHYPVADELSRQEAAIAQNAGGTIPVDLETEGAEIEVSSPKRYHKVPHFPHIHSWAPLFIQGDAIADASFEGIYDESAIGATLFFQDHLSTMTGTLGYFVGKDSDTKSFRHGGQVDLTYSGLYPVFHLTAEVGRRNARQYYRKRSESGPLAIDQVGALRLDAPYASADMEVYVPLNFSSGGWTRGVIPRVTYRISNDRFSKSLTVLDYSYNLEGSSMPIFSGSITDKNVPMQMFGANVRAYTMLPAASSAQYPRWGISLETGYRVRAGIADLYTAGLYAFTYGYLPGFVPQQGWRLSATYQHMLRTTSAKWENSISTLPRGYGDSKASSYLSAYSKNQANFTVDYAIPVNAGDISWFSPLVMIKNFVFKPYFDYSLFSVSGQNGLGGLYTAGMELTAVSGNFLWIPYEAEFGFSFGYNGGKSFDTLGQLGYDVDHTYVEAIFRIDL